MPPSPLQKIAILGAGRVGQGLALALKQTRHSIVALWNRAEPVSLNESLKAQLVTDDLATAPFLTKASLVLVTVSDAAIEKVARQLVQNPHLEKSTIVAHTSGSLPATTLAPLPSKSIGSFHPMASCSTPERAARVLKSCHFTLEGSPEACQRLQEIAISLGASSSKLETSQKARYHAACVMASNLMVALFHQATIEAREAGLDAPHLPLSQLATNTLQHIKEQGVQNALTGPVRRGDLSTIRTHLETLSGRSSEVYRLLSQGAQELVPNADRQTRQQIEELLATNLRP